MKGERVRNGATEEGFVDYYGLAVDHGRYNISANVGTCGKPGCGCSCMCCCECGCGCGCCLFSLE